MSCKTCPNKNRSFLLPPPPGSLPGTICTLRNNFNTLPVTPLKNWNYDDNTKNWQDSERNGCVSPTVLSGNCKSEIYYDEDLKKIYKLCPKECGSNSGWPPSTNEAPYLYTAQLIIRKSI